VTEAQATELPFTGRTAWSRNLATPLRRYLRTETGSAGVLLAGVIAALVWANADSSSYASTWETELSIRLGDASIALDLRGWVNAGLMSFFFLVVGLEVRREFDMGELRDRARVTLPLLAGLGGMVVPIAIYLAFNAGEPSAHGWGVAMSTDTAFALGVLALVGPRFPERLRSYLLTVVVADDVLALVVIATVYSGDIETKALLPAIGFYAVALLLVRARIRIGLLYLGLGIGLWISLYEAGVEPVVTGLVMGLAATAYTPTRSDLERATDLFRLFREQPTPELARTVRTGVDLTLSPNERLQRIFHPWTSYVIVPLFALANAGIAIDSNLLSRAFTSPITLGILVGYVVGKPVGVSATTLLVTRVSRGRLKLPVGWAGLLGAGAVAGIGFTVSLLIATLAFAGPDLEEAKAGILSAALVSSVLAWVIFRATDLLPHRLRVRALVGREEAIVDLAVSVDPDRDHIRGPESASVVLLEYGDYECPYCGQAEEVIRELLSDFGDLQYVWRHLPLNDVHSHAQQAAEAAEAAHAQGAFWEMHDLLLGHQRALRLPDLVAYAEQLGLDRDRFIHDVEERRHSARIAEDVDSADMSGVSGTPSFFINGRRHYGAYDIEALTSAVRLAKTRATLAR
jgi:Na+/H+ antiporter NhaA